MIIKFENYGYFYCFLVYTDNYVIDYRNEAMPHNLRECTEFIEYKMEYNPRIMRGIICDWDTDEVVATIERKHVEAK